MKTVSLLFVLFLTSLRGETCSLFEENFQEWGQKRLDLFALFLPPHPTILQLDRSNCQNQELDSIDFLCLDVEGAELQVLKSSPQMVKTAKCIYVHTDLFPSCPSTTRYSDLKKFMSQSGFMLIAHWPRKEREGDALFVKQAFFYNSKIGEYLKKNKITDEHSKIYYEPFFKSYYYLEDNTDDSLKSILKEGLPYEGEIGLIIDDLTETGSLALDVGSHIGIHTITMSRKTGPQGAVIAFEPDKKYYMELLETLSLNECTNVLPICKALGDTCKSAFFQKYMIQEEAVGVGDWVETLSLDSLHLNNVSLIKMDIENYEYFALKGAQETLLRNKPVIIFECWIGKDYAKSDPKERANFDRVISLLESYDYEIFVIYSNDFIAFPRHGKSKLESYKNRFRKLDLNNFDLGLIQ